MEEDVAILNDGEISGKLRAVITYRAERKKILHSQLYLVDMFADIVLQLQVPYYFDFESRFKQIVMAKNTQEQAIDLSKDLN